MVLLDIYQRLGEAAFGELLRSISLGRLRTYQLFDRVKTRLHLQKLNSENLKKIAPRTWQRLSEGDEALGQELSQAILISNIEMIKAVLDFIGIPHEDGFFAKEIKAEEHLTEGWQQRVFANFQGQYPQAVLVFYVNHLGMELGGATEFVAPAAA